MSDIIAKEEILSALNKHFETIKQLVRYSKSKDLAIERQSKELQKYRDGFVFTAFKPLAISIINCRENFKREYNTLDAANITVERLNRNFMFLIDEIEGLLLQNGVDEDDGKYYYCGRDICKPVNYLSKTESENSVDSEPVISDSSIERETLQDDVADDTTTAEQSELMDENETQCEESVSLENINEMVGAFKRELIDTIKDNEVLENNVLKAIEDYSKVDELNKFLYVRPVLYELSRIIGRLRQMSLEGDLEECRQQYKDILKEIYGKALVEALETIGCEIVVGETAGDEFDAKHDRLLKSVPTDDETLNRKIKTVISDAYILDGKLIYPRKVEVYVYKA